jgi:hypothetical protein
VERIVARVDWMAAHRRRSAASRLCSTVSASASERAVCVRLSLMALKPRTSATATSTARIVQGCSLIHFINGPVGPFTKLLSCGASVG